MAGQNVCIRKRTMQLVLLLGVKLAEVYSGKTHISLPILCLFLPLPRLFFFLAACALAGIQTEQWLLKIIFWRDRTVPTVLVYLIQTFCLCKDSPFCKTVFFSYMSEF